MKESPTMSPNPRPPCLYSLPATIDGDLATLRSLTNDYLAGRIEEAQFKAFTGPLGLAEQREQGTYMVRLRLPAGVVLPQQLRVLAEVSSRYGDGVLHLTTRQNLQVHGVPLASVPDAVAALRAADLCSRAAGGNAVRSVTACVRSGVCPDEVFDTAPYAVALTEFLLADPRSWQLPRKYKLACSGCGRDCGGATVADIGLVAAERDGVRGFAVYAAGGLGARPAPAQLFEEFFPAAEIHLLAEAVKRVFHQHGNRENRAHARIRFLVEDLGLARFRELVYGELEGLRAEAPVAPEVRPLPQPGLPDDQGAPAVAGPEFAAWRTANVSPQAQPGRYLVTVPFALGMLPVAQAEALAAIAAEYGEGLLWATPEQNALLRWVAEADLPALQGRLEDAGLAVALPPVLRSLAVCTGAATCRPGLLRSRGLAEAVAARLQGSGLDLAACGELSLKISGCPNSCGRQQLADIGLAGGSRKVGERPVPHYTVYLGGKLGVGETRFGEKWGVLPARAVPAFVEGLLALYADSPQCGDFAAFLEAGRAEIEQLLAAHEPVPSFEEDGSYYCDWGTEAN